MRDSPGWAKKYFFCAPPLFLVLAFSAFSFWTPVPSVQARSNHAEVAADIATVTLAELPGEARATLQLIKQGGPFPYARDGLVFKNFEQILPKQARGYYREYTVKTPGARNRGARRIVCGILPECYYSGDHYRTFKRIRE
ncbi:MAG: ribonuclease [Candidatus Nitrotoga sp.]